MPRRHHRNQIKQDAFVQQRREHRAALQRLRRGHVDTNPPLAAVASRVEVTDDDDCIVVASPAKLVQQYDRSSNPSVGPARQGRATEPRYQLRVPSTENDSPINSDPLTPQEPSPNRSPQSVRQQAINSDVESLRVRLAARTLSSPRTGRPEPRTPTRRSSRQVRQAHHSSPTRRTHPPSEPTHQLRNNPPINTTPTPATQRIPSQRYTASYAGPSFPPDESDGDYSDCVVVRTPRSVRQDDPSIPQLSDIEEPGLAAGQSSSAQRTRPSLPRSRSLDGSWRGSDSSKSNSSESSADEQQVTLERSRARARVTPRSPLKRTRELLAVVIPAPFVRRPRTRNQRPAPSSPGSAIPSADESPPKRARVSSGFVAHAITAVDTNDSDSEYDPHDVPQRNTRTSAAAAIDSESADTSGDDAEPEPPSTRPSPLSLDALQKSFRLHGCTHPQHGASNDNIHESAHLDLAELASHWEQELGIPDILQITSDQSGPPVYEVDTIHGIVWEQALAGASTFHGMDDSERIRLSLRKSCQASCMRPIHVTRTWDIDAFLVPLESLGACTFGLDLFYTPRYAKTITQDWHTPIGPSRIDPRHCKHLRIARARGPHTFEIFIFFPDLPLPPRLKRNPKGRASRSYPRKDQQRVWVDEILIPALCEVYDGDILGQHPESFAKADDQARARQKESVSSVERAFSEVAYHLPSQTPNRDRPGSPLHRLWEGICARARSRPGWQDLHLVAVSYGCKLDFRSPTLDGLLAKVDSTLQQMFESRHVALDHTFVDLAYEDRAFGEDDRHGVPQRLLLIRRSDCNTADAESLGLGRTAQYFNWHATADGSSYRATPGKTSALRAGGVAYVQAYNTQKNMFTLPDGSAPALFSEKRLPHLAFSQTNWPAVAAGSAPYTTYATQRHRALQALGQNIRRTHNAINAAAGAASGASVRQEYRIGWHVFRAVATAPSQPVLAEGSHWPFWALRVEDALAFMRWNTNRWLFAACTVLGVSLHSGPGEAPLKSLDSEKERAAMLAVFLQCLEIQINSGALARWNRFAKSRYYTKSETVRVRPNPDDQHDDVAQGDSTSGEDSDVVADRGIEGLVSRRARRGLGLLESARASNVAWLPGDMFEWSSLRFKPAVLPQTAFHYGVTQSDEAALATISLEHAFRTFVQRQLTSGARRSYSSLDGLFLVCRDIFAALHQLCLFRFANFVLSRLGKGPNALQNFNSQTISDQERMGCFGLSYGLISAARGRTLKLSYSRGSGGLGPAGTTKGFSAFPNDWETRIQLLFDTDDDFGRENWAKSVWQVWTQYCHAQIQHTFGVVAADRWRSGIGAYGASFFSVLPKYDRYSILRCEKRVRGASHATSLARSQQREYLWLAAQPIALIPSSDIDVNTPPWQMLVCGKGYQTANYLPELLVYGHPIVQGREFDLIAEVTAVAGARGEDQ